MGPDPDYEPEVGEWFWAFYGSDGWRLCRMKKDGIYIDGKFKSPNYDGFRGYCQPATAPDEPAVSAGPPNAEDAPPDGTKPDKDYKPDIGEWFWWYDSCDWVLRHRTPKAIKKLGSGFGCSTANWDRCYEGKCLPLDWNR